MENGSYITFIRGRGGGSSAVCVLTGMCKYEIEGKGTFWTLKDRVRRSECYLSSSHITAYISLNIQDI